MITKKYGVDFYSKGGALTLRSEDIGAHNDGWTIKGKIVEEHFEWVNDFEAYHPIYGKVWGNFEFEVFADSEEAYRNFYKKHPPLAWDYEDI